MLLLWLVFSPTSLWYGVNTDQGDKYTLVNVPMRDNYYKTLVIPGIAGSGTGHFKSQLY